MTSPAPSSPPRDWRTVPTGTRLVVRRRRDDSPAPGQPRLTDVLGDLVAVDEEGMTIRTRRGDVHVPGADVVLLKQVPPAPVRRH